MMRMMGKRSKRIVYILAGAVALIGLLWLTLVSPTCQSEPVLESNEETDNEEHFITDTIPTINYSKRLKFINYRANDIVGNVDALDPFYRSLVNLREKRERRVVSIFHLGDSHMQAGFLSGMVMSLLQRTFGNAGRGLIVPLKLAKTNEPWDYEIESPVSWRTSRSTSPRPIVVPIGISGLSLSNETDRSSLLIKTFARGKEDYAFNTLKIFHSKKTQFSVDDASNQGRIVDQTKYTTTIKLQHPSRLIKLRAALSDENKQVTFSAVSLQNDSAGVLYHAAGLNGAQYIHYRKIEDFGAQIAELSPELIVFSLGTNETFRDDLSAEQLKREIGALIEPIKEHNPHASILLTTPAECQRRAATKKGKKFERNPKIEITRKAIIEYAEENRYPYWDLFAISGGKGSSEKWIESNLLTRDRVHFEVPGYKIQGEILYDAIIRGYNNYVRKHNR